ncbi:polysaccharide biosynthesis tyrosine autokinase [Gemmata sp. JC717]|uniref:polysaccharide biosynthesis tyrosine autokinase n=1 Tax=Gemmata algarum TaxID=2975278 RepID=UPI0021BAA57E|nr:polysaccharide biosynthesis tyrosine autokinase [Gemmata algarum]MDY3551846.1 polysaccharide biosynthesis tyrosine autokinase [Gemmata algarum]
MADTDKNTAAPPDDDEPASGLNPLHLVMRRWQFLAVGLIIGGVLGALIYSTSAPQYQSTAQVLVVKKGVEVTKEGDGRVVEDHVATQVTLIKSEKIRLAAAAKARAAGGAGLPADDRAVADMIGTGLTVVRDKDSAGPTVGSGVLNLTLREPDPELCKRLLEAVIAAYQAELYSIYEKASQDRIATLDRLLEAVKGQRKAAGEHRITHLTELRGITTEDVSSVRTRVSALRDQARALRTDISNLDAQIELVGRTGPAPEDRQLAFVQLTAQYRAPVVPTAASGGELTGPAALRALEFERRELTQAAGLGKDHPRVLAVDARIAVLKEELARPPAAGGPVLDELGAHILWVEQKRRTAGRQLAQLEAQLSKDEETMKRAGGLLDLADAMAVQSQHADAEIMRLEAERLARQATLGAGGYAAEQITRPGSGHKVAPVLVRSLLLGLGIGALLGCGLMVLAETRDKSFRSPAEIRRRLGLAVVGHIPRIRTAPALSLEPATYDPLLVAALRPKSSEAEAYRGLRTQLYFSTQGRGHQVIQVTSPTPGDGKSTLAANLALSVAQSGKRTILVDCDLRKPRVHKLFAGAGAPETGLAEVIAGLRPLADGIVASGAPGLDLLPCGPRPANPAELLGSPQFQRVLAELRERYEFVIVDSPPLMAVADPAIVAPQADGVLVVFRMTKTARPAAERAREVLAGVGAHTIGVVVNASGDEGRGYGYGYGYGYEYKYTSYKYSDSYNADADEDGARRVPAPTR